MYYYIYRNKVVETPFEINTFLNKGYVELTPMQKKFYLANPDASIEDVREATSTKKISEIKSRTIAEPEFTTDDKWMMKDELRQRYEGKLNNVSMLDFATAVAVILSDDEDEKLPMTKNEAKTKLSEFLTIVSDNKDNYAAAKESIDNAESREACEDIVTAFDMGERIDAPVEKGTEER